MWFKHSDWLLSNYHTITELQMNVAKSYTTIYGYNLCLDIGWGVQELNSRPLKGSVLSTAITTRPPNQPQRVFFKLNGAKSCSNYIFKYLYINEWQTYC